MRIRIALAPLFLLAVAGRLPGGITIEVFNNSGSEASVTAVFNDGSSATRPLPPGRAEAFERALTWHVFARGARSELRHPGAAFETKGWLGGQRYRFQLEPSGCLYALAPEQEPPVREFAIQPSGYPIGCASPPPPAPAARD